MATLPKWPRYPEHWHTVDAVNSRLTEWARSSDEVSILDTRPLLMQGGNLPVTASFRTDGVNLNDWGYTQLSLMLRQRMEIDYPHFY